MAQVEKYNDSGVMMLLKHSNRQLKNDANKDIVKEKSDLNYSIKMEYNGLTPKQLYQQIKDDSYLYGRGSVREEKSVTCCSWVVTLPKSVSDYSSIDKNEIKILNPEQENAFFTAVNQFVANRYETVFYNRIHYDEGGQPHIHIYFVPRTTLNHDVVHYKTVKTHQTVKTETGRYEYAQRFKLENGEKIPLKNYAKMSDYYDAKISAADVLNKAELQHFHQDLAEYLKKHNIPGADRIYSGKTDGKNISVKDLKEFTKVSGVTINELKEHPLPQDELRELLNRPELNLNYSTKSKIEAINNEAIIAQLQSKIYEYEKELTTYDPFYISDLKSEILQKNKYIEELKLAISEKEHDLSDLLQHTMSLDEKISDLEKNIEFQKSELEQAHITELEQEKSIKTDIASSWGTQADWGHKNLNRDEEKTW